MIIVIAAIIIALACYLMGFCIGKRYAEEQFRELRGELETEEQDDGIGTSQVAQQSFLR